MMKSILIYFGTLALVIHESVSLRTLIDPSYNSDLKVWGICRTKLNMAGFGTTKPLTPNEGSKDSKSVKKQILTVDDNDNCICCSGLKYVDCCKHLHTRLLFAEPISIVRARYSAYAVGLGDFLIQTTHKTHKAGQHFRIIAYYRYCQ